MNSSRCGPLGRRLRVASLTLVALTWLGLGRASALHSPAAGS
jgi:hypothetical protein